MNNHITNVLNRSENEITNTFIYLIGFSGTGKLTIATELHKRIPSILVDNHLINNVVFSLIDTDGLSRLPRKVWDNARKVRHIVLDTIRELSRPDRNFIFTNELIEGSKVDEEYFSEIASLAESRGASLFPVRLLISEEELCRRIVSPERKAKFKAMDPNSVRNKILTKEVFKPPCAYFDLDVTELAATTSADKIILEIERRLKGSL